MIVSYTTTQHPNLYTIHFSCELPVFPDFHTPWGARIWTLSRAVSLGPAAEQMAHRNAGCFSVELEDPVREYHDFLSELVLIEGLGRIVGARRYLLAAEIGHCFETHVVITEIAACVTRHFYTGRRVVVQFDAPPNEAHSVSRTTTGDTPSKRQPDA